MIYFIRCNEFIKIGFTDNNPILRLRDLQVGNPTELILIKTISGTHSLEQHLHKKFNHIHYRGEWFNITDELINYINCAPSFPVIELLSQNIIYTASDIQFILSNNDIRNMCFQFHKIKKQIKRKRSNKNKVTIVKKNGIQYKINTLSLYYYLKRI
jgi:hypothetical protein